MNHSHPKWFTPDFPASSVSSKFAAECLVTNQSLQLQLRLQVALKLHLLLRLLKKLESDHRLVTDIGNGHAEFQTLCGFHLFQLGFGDPKVWELLEQHKP